MQIGYADASKHNVCPTLYIIRGLPGAVMDKMRKEFELTV